MILTNTEKNKEASMIYKLNKLDLNNDFYIKRDDLYPFSFGGNKARKAELFWKDLKNKGADCVVTYGTSSSNHCRVIANLAAGDGVPCTIISPIEQKKQTYNKILIELFNAEIVFSPVEKVKETINTVLAKLEKDGKHPYFIMGGGHGNIGTQAYVNVYSEICRYEKENRIKFDYIFHASGTGTTQSGLVCGQILNGETENRIVGISIARKNPYGRDVVVESVRDYLANTDWKDKFDEQMVEFDDTYTNSGYGVTNDCIREWILKLMKSEGIPLDETYTGKAFAGMIEWLKKKQIENKKILFIHTGGTPLFFDYLNGIC